MRVVLYYLNLWQRFTGNTIEKKTENISLFFKGCLSYFAGHIITWYSE